MCVNMSIRIRGHTCVCLEGVGERLLFEYCLPKGRERVSIILCTMFCDQTGPRASAQQPLCVFTYTQTDININAQQPTNLSLFTHSKLTLVSDSYLAS